jgi:hypothetical protein
MFGSFSLKSLTGYSIRRTFFLHKVFYRFFFIRRGGFFVLVRECERGLESCASCARFFCDICAFVSRSLRQPTKPENF